MSDVTEVQKYATIALMERGVQRDLASAARAALASATPQERTARRAQLANLVNTRKGLTKDSQPVLSDSVTGDRDRFLTDAIVQCVSESRGVYTLWCSGGTAWHSQLLDTAIAAGYRLSYSINGRSALTITGTDVLDYLARMQYVIRPARATRIGVGAEVVTVPGCGDVLSPVGTMLLNGNVTSWQAMIDRALAYQESIGTTYHSFDTVHRTDTYIETVRPIPGTIDVNELETDLLRADVVRDLLETAFSERHGNLLEAELLRASVLSDVEAAKRGLVEFQRTAYRVGLPLDIASTLRSEAKRAHRDTCAAVVSESGLTVSAREAVIARADSRLSRELTCIDRHGINGRELQRIESQLATELERLQTLQRDVAEYVRLTRDLLRNQVKTAMASRDAQALTIVQQRRAANAAIVQRRRDSATDLQRKVWAIEKSIRRCRDDAKLAVLRQREALAKLELAAENATRREAQLATELAERETLAGLDAACGAAEAKVI